MDPEIASLAHSDYSESSVASLGPSIQNEDLDTLLVNDRSFIRPIRRSNESSETGSSWHASVFLLVNAALGAGLLNFPAAYHACGGLGVAIVVQTILAVLSAVSMLSLTKSSQVFNSSTYQDVVYSTCGRAARVICSLSIALYSFGACITYIIIVGDQWDKFLQFAYGKNFEDFWYMSRKFTSTITSVVFILPICFAKRIDFLKYVSAAGVLAVLYCVVLIVVKYFVGVDPDSVGPVVNKPESWTQVFAVVPVICFGYQAQTNMVPIFACTRNRTVKEFSKTITISTFICFLFYGLAGTMGYLTFGSKTSPDILLSYAPTADVLIAVILIGLKMYTTYPLLLFVGSHLSLVPIFSCTRDRSIRDFSKTISSSTFICFLCYGLAGSMGYLTFGSKTSPDILLSYAPTVEVLIAVILIALKMYTTYPLLLFVGRSSIDSVWEEIRQNSASSTGDVVQYELVRRIIVTFVWFISTLVLALFIPDIGIVISYLGALAAIFIFVFPGLCLLQLLLNNHLGVMCWGRQIAVYATVFLFLILGSFIFGQVIVQSVLNSIRPSSIFPPSPNSSYLLNQPHLFWPNMPTAF